MLRIPSFYFTVIVILLDFVLRFFATYDLFFYSYYDSSRFFNPHSLGVDAVLLVKLSWAMDVRSDVSLSCTFSLHRLYSPLTHCRFL